MNQRQQILVGLSVCGVCILIVVVGSKAFHASQQAAREVAAEKQRVADAQGLVKSWADRLDAQTSDSGVYKKINDTTESNLPENDPWGRPLKVLYSKGGVMEVLKVICLGPDGTQGTKDDLEATRQATNFSGIKSSLTPKFLKKDKD